MGNMDIKFDNNIIGQNNIYNESNINNNYEKLTKEINDIIDTKILSDSDKKHLLNIRTYSEANDKKKLIQYLKENKEYILNGAIANLFSGTILAFLNGVLK